MRIGVIDTETTSNDVNRDAIIEVAAVFIEDKKICEKYEQRIFTDKKIAAAALRIHGISNADLIGQPTFAEVATELQRKLQACDLLVGHNILKFDAPLLLNEFKRVGINKDLPPCFDTMLKGRDCTPDGKVPSLREFCWAYGVPYDTELAHAALYDCEVLAEAFLRMAAMK